MSKKKRKAPKGKPQAKESVDNQIEVKLHRFLGIAPGAYLTVLYGLAVAFILFMLFFYKGIRDRGVYLDLTTFPSGASVRIDDDYAGSSPCEVLVKKGFHRITISKPYFDTETFEETFAGPVFATLFIRPRRVMNVDLRLEDPAGMVHYALEDFASTPYIPEILTETVLSGYKSSIARDELYFFIDKSKYFITSPLQLHQYLYAASLLAAKIQVMTPSSLLSTVTQIIHLKQKYENFPFWLTAVLPKEEAQRVAGTSWFTGFLSRYRDRLAEEAQRASTANESLQRSPGRPIRIQGLLFYPVPDGFALQGASERSTLNVQIPHPVQIDSFWMSETEISNGQYREFLDDNPEWKPGNLPQLTEKGLVEENYLVGWQENPGWEELPVTNVSFHAAQAFCRWFSSKLPASFEGYTIRLPFESEWEWAARGGLIARDYPRGSHADGERFFKPGISGAAPVGSSPTNGYGLRDMMGNVWEWCLDWYSPVNYMLTSWQAEANNFDSSYQVPFGAEKVIRGGSWTNEEELITVSTRGAQPPQWCTPYLGFRIILSRYSP
jgi:iron(II)-dependent oxidoreductase